MRTHQAAPDSLEGRVAASRLLARYRRKAYVWCYRHVRHHEQALDLAQEALMKAFRALPTFEHRARFSSWFFAIAHHHCVSARRAAHLPKADDFELAELIDPAPPPADELESRQREERVLALIRSHLTPLEQRALWLRCFEEMGVDDITRVLRIDAPSGARGVLQNARRKLRAALGREAEGERGTES